LPDDGADEPAKMKQVAREPEQDPREEEKHPAEEEID
jgi:hypothetical protein